jgi:RNA polymerase sigma-70 factor (ECF subfamily)
VSVPPTDGLAADLFARHGGPVRRYLRALTGSVELAEDLAQDVFVRVVRHADRYEPRERERAWLFRIARTTLIDHRRRLAARPAAADGEVEPAMPASQGLRLDLQRALAGLPEAEHEAFLLAEVAGLTYAEIAQTLELTVPAVRSAIYRARLALRATLMPPPPIAPPSRRGQDHDD